MNNWKYLFIASCTVFLAACSADNDVTENNTQNQLPTQKMSFTANIEVEGKSDNITRTSLGNDGKSTYPVWKTNDQIKVLNTLTTGEKSQGLFNLGSGYDGQRAAEFNGDILVNSNSGNKFYALYNANVASESNPTTLTYSDGTVSFNGVIDADQPTDFGFHPNYHYMTACTTGTAFRFKNAVSMFHLNIEDNNYSNFGICKIILKANNETEKIAGAFTATIADNGVPTITNVTNGTNTITIGNGTTPLSSGDYYIAILPCGFEQGFTLTFEDNRIDKRYDEQNANHKVYDRIKSSAFSVGASEIIDLGTYTAKAVAKEAYVDLGLTSKTKWCIENVYDEAGENIAVPTGVDERKTVETSPSSSYYAWGETYVKSNQYKVDKCNNYSWYYTYGIGTGSNGTSDDSEKDLSKNSQKRSYKFGIGKGGLGDFITSTSNGGYVPRRLNFDKSNDGDGVLLKYNDTDEYISGGADWGGGVNDGLRFLDLADDAVNKKATLSKSVRIPVATQFDELFDETTVTLSSDNKSYIFTSNTNGRFITLPIGGYKQIKTVENPSWGKYEFGPQDWDLTTACYWTRHRTYIQEKIGSNKTGHQDYNAQSFVISNNGNAISKQTVNAARCQGRMLRGVVDYSIGKK